MLLETSRCGLVTARVGKRYIHSRYNPLKEAGQYYTAWKNQQAVTSGKLVILVEPGLGYLIDILAGDHPKQDILVIFLSGDSLNYCLTHNKLNNIQYSLQSQPDSLFTTLDTFIGRRHYKDILFLEWTAGSAIFNKASCALKNKILDYTRIRQGNELTSRQYSYRIFVNAIHNYLRFDYSNGISGIMHPVILAASGPSLEHHLTDMKSFQDNYIIAALPSSARILAEHGIQWDILFSTDPGYYAREHLKYQDNTSLTISPLTAAGSQNCTYMGFHQNSYIEQLLLKDSELPFIPERGTVAATALELLSQCWKGDIYIAGLDFSLYDIKMHAAPHSFDPVILKNESRFSPGIGCYYSRVHTMTHHKTGLIRHSKSMNTYAAWFNNRKFRKNIYRLKPVFRNLDMNTMSQIPRITTQKALKVVKNRYFPDYKTRKERINHLAGSLESIIQGKGQSGEFFIFMENVFPRSLESNRYDFHEKAFALLGKIKRICS